MRTLQELAEKNQRRVNKLDHVCLKQEKEHANRVGELEGLYSVREDLLLLLVITSTLNVLTLVISSGLFFLCVCVCMCGGVYFCVCVDTLGCFLRVPGAGREDHSCLHQGGALRRPAGELELQEDACHGGTEPHGTFEGV